MEQENSGRGGTYRAALTAVIILGVLLVAGMVALVFGFVRQYKLYQASRSASISSGVSSGMAPALVELAPGARIVSVKTTPNRLILQLATPKGGEVEVLDLASGKLLFQVASPKP